MEDIVCDWGDAPVDKKDWKWKESWEEAMTFSKAKMK